MRKLKSLLWIATLGLLVSCGGEGDRNADGNENGIEITGNVKGANNQKVYLYVFEEEGNRVVDSAIVEDNSFSVWTDTKEFREYILEIGRQNNNLVKENNYIYLLPDEKSTTIEISGTFPGIGENYEIKGCQNSMDFKEYLGFSGPYYREIEALQQQYDVEQDTSKAKVLSNQMDSIKNYVADYAKDYIDEKPGSPVSWIMLKELFPATGLKGFDTTNFIYFDKVRDGLKENYPYSNLSQNVEDTKKNTQAQLDELKRNPDGDLAPDIVLNDPDGKEISLSSLRGKVVLVDFWASWCKPCRQENPNVVKTYNEYKDKGFTVYSVSLDQNKDAWLKAIENDNLVWPNHVSDLKGWNSQAAIDYDVKSIPSTFLIDREGKIIDANLRGGRLEQRLQEILG